MPRVDKAAANGGREDELFSGLEEDALAWDTGLSLFLGRLEEELIRWHSEERVKAKGRQAKCARAQKDLLAAEAIVKEASAPRELKGPDDQPWQEKLKELLQQAKDQRDEQRQLLELLRSHTKLHLEAVGGAALLQKLPSEGQPLAPGGEELSKFLKLFLELADKQPAEPAKETEKQATKKEEKAKKRKGLAEKKLKKKAKKEAQRAQSRAMREGSPESEWSSSRSPSISEARHDRRHDRRGRHRRYSPSMDSRSFSDSRSPSLSQSRGPMRRRAHPGARRDPGRAGRGGGRARTGGGGGGGGGGSRREDVDIPKEIDRFCHVNKLESRCEKILRDLSPALARQVMGFSGGTNTFELSGDVRDPTAVVLARVRKAREERLRGGGPPRRGGKGRGRERPPASSRSRSRSRSPPARSRNPTVKRDAGRVEDEL